jgi:hypothetical protein
LPPNVSMLRFMHLGLFLVQISSPLCLFSWEFMGDCSRGWWLNSDMFSCLKMGVSGSILILSPSYCKDVDFYPLFYIGQGGLSINLVILIELQPWNVTVISDEDQLLLVFQYVWFSIGAKVNLCGPRKLKVIRVVMGGRQRESSTG